jgi:hypothetical protein
VSIVARIAPGVEATAPLPLIRRRRGALLWETDQALGHEIRNKIHIFICEEDAFDGHTFLFISSADYGGDFKLLQSEYEFLTHDSFVSIGRIVCYTDTQLATYKIKAVGQLTKEHLQKLFHTVQGSETMEGKDIKRVCNALKGIL